MVEDIRYLSFMYYLVFGTLIAAVVCFFVILALSVGAAFGWIKIHDENRSMVKRMFTASVITVLVAAGAFVSASFKYVDFDVKEYIGLTNDIRNIQKVLGAEDILDDEIDGAIGRNTFAAIARFQELNNLSPSSAGALDEETVDKLFDWNNRESLLTDQNQHHLRNHLKKPTFSQLKRQVKWVQEVLQRHGCYEGEIDGILKPAIAESVSAFQKQKGINDDGAIGYEVLAYAIESDINSFYFLKNRRDE